MLRACCPRCQDVALQLSEYPVDDDSVMVFVQCTCCGGLYAAETCRDGNSVLKGMFHQRAVARVGSVVGALPEAQQAA